MQLVASTDRKPYKEKTRKLVIAFDIGTTFSGASFAKLEPGMVPNIQGVMRYPAQHKANSSKIPSIIYYDSKGVVQAVGEEAVDEAFLECAEDEGYFKVEWFKLHLRPKGMSQHINDADIPSLPANKRPIDVFADFLAYMYECTRKYISDATHKGEAYLASVKNNIDFVLTHPNGWEGRQQALMRQAAVDAGLVKAAEAQSRVQFVTEGEASLHYCMADGTLNSINNNREGIIIVDAGGGTVDLSAYQKTGGGTGGGWSFKEIAPIQCRLQGSVFVTRRAQAYLEKRLKGSRFGSREDARQIAEAFDSTTKLTVRHGNPDTPYHIRFGGIRDTDRRVDIRSGQMKIAGDIVAGFFQPSISAVVEAVKAQKTASSIPIKTVIIVGGFAANDWLFSNVRTALGPIGLNVFRPGQEGQHRDLSKAVANGAISYFLDHVVKMRTTRFSYGTNARTQYDASRPDHRERAHLIYQTMAGDLCIDDVYDEILAKGVTINEEHEFRRDYVREFPRRSSARIVKDKIMSFRGGEAPPHWISDDKDLFSTLCTVTSDLYPLSEQTKPKSFGGKSYFPLEYDIILIFGLTELKAQTAWTDSEGKEHRTPAVVVYDEE